VKEKRVLELIEVKTKTRSGGGRACPNERMDGGKGGRGTFTLGRGANLEDSD